MKCYHTIDGSLLPCLGGTRGSDAGLGGLGGGGSPSAPNLDGASISI